MIRAPRTLSCVTAELRSGLPQQQPCADPAQGTYIAAAVTRPRTCQWRRVAEIARDFTDASMPFDVCRPGRTIT